MPKYEFALRSAETIREAGVVVSDDFAEAMSTIQEHAPIDEGDLLLIGVPGFPPAEYRCIRMEERAEGWVPVWRPQGLLA
jgi:hypothetical protein